MNTPEREDLPELPEPSVKSFKLATHDTSGHVIYTYSADQLRAYGRLCREDGRRVDEAKTDRDKCADDLRAFGRSFMCDGKRIDPSTVRIVWDDDGRRAPQPDASAEGREGEVVDCSPDLSASNRIWQRLRWLERGERIDVKEFVEDVESLLRRPAPKAGDVVAYRVEWTADSEGNPGFVTMDSERAAMLRANEAIAAGFSGVEVLPLGYAPSAPVAGSGEEKV
jgi:hypothetical protein